MGNPIRMCSAIYRGEILRQFRWPSDDRDGINGDWLLHIWHAQHGQVGYLDDVMGVRRKHRNSLYGSLDLVEQARWRAETLCVIQDWLGEKHQNMIKLRLFNMCLDVAGAYARRNHRKLGREYLIKAFTTSPFNKKVLSGRFVAAFLRLYFPYFVPPLVACKRKLTRRA